MVDRIESLTPEQTEMLDVYRDRWTHIGLRTLDERLSDHCLTAEDLRRLVDDVYRAGGVEPPEHIIPAGSLMSASIIAAVMRSAEAGQSVGDSVWDSVGASVRTSVWDSVGASVSDSVRDSVSDSVWASVRDSVRGSVWASVWDSVRGSASDSVRDSVSDSVWASVADSVWASVWASVADSVWASVWASVGDSVRDSVRTSVRDSVRDSVRTSVRDSVWGCYDAAWCGWAAYMDEQLHAAGAQVSRPLVEIAHHCGFFIPLRGFAIVSAPHTVIHRDDDGQLHSEDGPAIAYLDGYAVHAIHGHRVPADVIERPESITVERVNGEMNAETRRIMIERFPGGPGKYLADSGARVLDSGTVSTDTQDRDAPHLMRALIETHNGDRFLVGTDGSTRRTYYMPVPDDADTCEQAHNAIAPLGIRDSKIVSSS